MSAGLLQQQTLLFTSDVTSHLSAANDVVKMVASNDSENNKGKITFSNAGSNKVDLLGIQDAICGGTLSCVTMKCTTQASDNLSVAEDAYIGKDLSVIEDASIGQSLSVGTNLSVGTDATIGNDLSVVMNATIGANLSVNSNATISGSLTAGATTCSTMTCNTSLSCAGPVGCTNFNASGNATIAGNLTVNGTTTTLSTTNTVIEDNLIELNNGFTSDPVNDSGILIQRGSGDNAFMGWDESEDKFRLATTTADADATGDLTLTNAGLECGTLSAGATHCTSVGCGAVTCTGVTCTGDLSGVNISASGTLSVGNAAHLASTLSVLSDTTIAGAVTINDTTTAGSDKSSGALVVDGGVCIKDNLRVSQKAYLYEQTFVEDTTDLYAFQVQGGATISKNVKIWGGATIDGTLSAGVTHCTSVDCSGAVDCGAVDCTGVTCTGDLSGVNISASGTLSVQQAAYLQSTLSVVSDTTIGGDATIDGTLSAGATHCTSVDCGAVDCGAVDCTGVTCTGDLSGVNISASGTLSVGNAAHLASTLSVLSDTTIAGTLSAGATHCTTVKTAAVTCTSVVDYFALQVKGGATIEKNIQILQGARIDGTLSAGATHCTSVDCGAVTCTGVTTGGNDVNCGAGAITCGNATCSGTLSVLQDTTIYGTTTLDAQIGSTSTDEGSLIVNGGVGIGENLNVGGTLSVHSNASIAGLLSVSSLKSGDVNCTAINCGEITTNGNDVSCGGGAITCGDATCSGNLSTEGSLSVGDAAHLESTLSVLSDATIAGDATIDGTLSAGATHCTSVDCGAVDCGAVDCTGVTCTGDLSGVNISASGTLSVGNAAHLASTLSVVSDTTIGGDATIDGTLSAGATHCTSVSCGAVTCTGVTSTGSVSCTGVTSTGSVSCTGVTCSTVTASGAINITDATESTSTGTGCLILAGGVGIAKNAHIGGNAHANMFIATSDERLKKNVKTIDNVLDLVRDEKFRGVSWEWKDAKKRGSGTLRGCLAQEMQAILPDAVREDQNGQLGVDYNSIIGVLMNAVKELTVQVDGLQQQQQQQQQAQ